MDPRFRPAYDGVTSRVGCHATFGLTAMILLLLRHAKAEPGGQGGDFERALTERGAADAQQLGLHLAEHGPAPQRALVSAARRTRQTFDLVAAALGGGAPPADHDDDLFEATAAELLAAVQRTTNAPCLLVVGHNPAVAELAASLAGDGADRQRLAKRFPPGSLAVLEFPGEDWRDARAGAGTLLSLVLPEDLPAR